MKVNIWTAQIEQSGILTGRFPKTEGHPGDDLFFYKRIAKMRVGNVMKDEFIPEIEVRIEQNRVEYLLGRRHGGPLLALLTLADIKPVSYTYIPNRDDYQLRQPRPGEVGITLHVIP